MSTDPKPQPTSETPETPEQVLRSLMSGDESARQVRQLEAALQKRMLVRLTYVCADDDKDAPRFEAMLRGYCAFNRTLTSAGRLRLSAAVALNNLRSATSRPHFQGCTEEAPFGTKPDGTPYTQLEFYDGIRAAVRGVYGIDFPFTEEDEEKAAKAAEEYLGDEAAAIDPDEPPRYEGILVGGSEESKRADARELIRSVRARAKARQRQAAQHSSAQHSPAPDSPVPDPLVRDSQPGWHGLAATTPTSARSQADAALARGMPLSEQARVGSRSDSHPPAPLVRDSRLPLTGSAVAEAVKGLAPTSEGPDVLRDSRVPPSSATPPRPTYPVAPLPKVSDIPPIVRKAFGIHLPPPTPTFSPAACGGVSADSADSALSPGAPGHSSLPTADSALSTQHSALPAAGSALRTQDSSLPPSPRPRPKVIVFNPTSRPKQPAYIPGGPVPDPYPSKPKDKWADW